MTCTRCGLEKQKEAFFSESRNRCGIRQPCKECLKTPKILVASKVCGKCKNEKPIEEFTKNIANQDGRNTICRTCASERQKEYVENLKARTELPAVIQKHCSACGEILPVSGFYRSKSRIDGYTETCVACRDAKRTAEYKRNPDIYKQRWARYMRDPETKKRYDAYRERWAKEHPGIVRRVQKRWHVANREHHASLVQSWYRTEKGKRHAKQKSANRRYLEKSAGRISSQTIRAIEEENIARFGFLTCIYCLRPIQEGYHLEHRLPLIRGGKNAKGNLAVSCPSCNLRKGILTDAEFMELAV